MQTIWRPWMFCIPIMPERGKRWPTSSLQNWIARRVRQWLQYKRCNRVRVFVLYQYGRIEFSVNDRRRSSRSRFGTKPYRRRSIHEVGPLSSLVRCILTAFRLPRVGLFLSKYKSGKLPKLFKVIPSLPAWARMLALTRPENWSPHACRAATRIFISNMKPAQAQLFLGVVLLDAVREDIRQNKKMNVHYYEALKRALYKPAAFFKGIIFPLLDVSFGFVVYSLH